MLARPASSSDSGAPESLVAGLREALAAASPAWRGFSGFADSIAATCAEFGGAPAADASYATMAVSSTAAITARILTDFRLSGRKADDANQATAEWPFSELRKALKRGFPRKTLWQGPVSMLSTVTNELKTATVRHGFREIPTTSRWAGFHLSRAARDRRSRDHILANSQAAVAGPSATPSCAHRHRAESARRCRSRGSQPRGH